MEASGNNRKVLSVATRAIAVVSLLVISALAVTYLAASGSDTPVSSEADRRLQWSAINYLTGPFALMSKSDRRLLRESRDRIETLAALLHYEAWTLDGLSRYCNRFNYNNPVPRYQLSLQHGTTYGDLHILDRSNPVLTRSLESTVDGVCSRGLGSSVVLDSRPPSYRRNQSGQTSVIGPQIIARNTGRGSVAGIAIEWEVVARGRPDAIAAGEIDEEIVGGLLPGETYTLNSTGWNYSHTNAIRDLIDRLGDVELEITACVDSLSISGDLFSDNSSYNRTTRIGCLQRDRLIRGTLRVIADAEPELRRFLSDTVLTTP